MTREEAIKELEEMIKYEWGTYQTKTAKIHVNALDMAIKALEQEPCEDAISRQEVLYLIADDDLSMGQVVRGIHALPSVTPQPRWIPVSERLPEKSSNYWCTFGTNLTGSDHYTTESDAKKLFDNPEEYAGWRSQNVIAWMPLPSSYERGEEE